MTKRSARTIEYSLTTPFVATAAVYQPVLTGTFIANGHNVLAHVDLCAFVLGTAFVPCQLWYAPASVGTMWIAGTTTGGLTPKSGVTQEVLGDLYEDSLGYLGKTVRITGLTPGVTYQFALMVAITGGSIQVPLSGLGGLAGPTDLVALPKRTKIYISMFYSNACAVLHTPGRLGQHSQFDRPYRHQFGGGITGIVQPFGINVTPNGSNIVAVGTTGHCYVINTATDTILSDTLCPGTTPALYGVCCPNNTTAYVSDYNNNMVYPVTLTTGAFGTGIAVGTHPWRSCATPDGTRVYVVNYGSASVSVITVATNTVATIALPSGSQPRDIDISHDGTFCVVVDIGNNKFHKIATATNTLAWSSAASSFSPVSIAIDADDLTAWVGCVSATGVVGHTQELWVRGPYEGQLFIDNLVMPAPTAWNISSVHVDNFGYIALVDFQNHQFWEWPNALFSCDPTSGFANEFCHVIIEDML